MQSEEHINQQTIEDFPEIQNTSKLLDEVEDPNIHAALSKADKLTLEIILMKMDGYSTRENATFLNLDDDAVNMRIYRLRKKIKKYF